LIKFVVEVNVGANEVSAGVDVGEEIFKIPVKFEAEKSLGLAVLEKSNP